MPEFLAADSIQRLLVVGGQSVDLNELLGVLEEQSSVGDNGRTAAMLSAHAHTLDALFHNLLRRAQANMNGG